MARKPRTVAAAPSARLKAPPKPRMGRKPVPENETRSDRFKRLGTKRMNNVIRQIQLLGNLCSPNYECDGNDLALMRSTILRELDMAIARFTPRKRDTGKAAFSFDGRNEETQH